MAKPRHKPLMTLARPPTCHRRIGATLHLAYTYEHISKVAFPAVTDLLVHLYNHPVPAFFAFSAPGVCISLATTCFIVYFATPPTPPYPKLHDFATGRYLIPDVS
jgi:hypothetical protein